MRKKRIVAHYKLDGSESWWKERTVFFFGSRKGVFSQKSDVC